jgi:hypothetical protein
MQNPHLQKAMLVVLFLAVIIAGVQPASFVAVMTVALVIIAALGVAELLKRA